MVNGQFPGNVRFAGNPPQSMATPSVNIGEKFGLICLHCFIFFSFSRVLDMTNTLAYLHLPLILGFLTVAVVLFQGGIPRAFGSNITRALLAFTLWAIIGLPFSYWRGGSLTTLKETWLKTILVYLAIAGLITTYKRLRTMIYTLGCAFVTATLLVMLFGVGEGERVALPQGELANSNQVALAMMLGLPLIWLIATDSTRFKPTRILFALATPFMLRVMFRAGSRAAVITLLLIFVLLLLEVSLVNKVKLLVGGCLMLLLIMGFLTRDLKARYGTLFSDDLVYGDEHTFEVQDSARRSTIGRRNLLLRGAVMTAKHPIFGVGMGNFAPASNENVKSGQRGDWGVTHNSYLQISSETGIPGLAFYALAMMLSWYKAKHVRKRAGFGPEWAELARIALGLRVGLLGLLVLMFFGSLAYNFYFPCFAGLVVALEFCSNQLMAKEAAAAAAAAAGRTEAVAGGPRKLSRGGYKQPLPA
jgi:O-antigen ligase